MGFAGVLTTPQTGTKLKQKYKNVAGGKMALSIFLGILMVTAVAVAFMVFVVNVVSKL